VKAHDVNPVPQRHSCVHRVLAGRLSSFERVGQLGVRLGLGGDTVRVQKIALALVAATSSSRGSVRGDIAYIVTGVDQELAEVPAQARRALDTPTVDRAKRAGPPDQLGEASRGHGEVLVPNGGSATVENSRGQGLSVRVGTHHVRVDGRHGRRQGLAPRLVG
jgi:hypothetical protein